jgi:indolepyruvate ferredoxin oxidoreductase
VTNVADEIGTAEVSPGRITIVDPGFTFEGKPWRHTQNPTLLPPYGLQMEREIHYGRLEAAKVFAAANGINRITLDTADAWLGIAAAGKTYYDLREALHELGLDDAGLRQHGIRLLKIGMLFPMEPGIVRHFARGLEEILVVEEKRSFVEMFLRDVLYNDAVHPRLVGKRDEQGRPLVPANGELDADRLAQIVANLVENAMKYARVEITVATSPTGDGFELTVTDDGSGIDEADLGRVFDRLYTVRETPGRSVGTGLGLAIVRELALAMGGTARAERPAPGGTSIVVAFERR